MPINVFIICIAIFGAFLLMADPNRIDLEHVSVEREILEIVKARAKGETSLREEFGDKEYSLYFGAREDGTENERTMIYEIMLGKTKDKRRTAPSRKKRKRSEDSEDMDPEMPKSDKKRIKSG